MKEARKMAARKNKHIGSSLDDFLKEEKIKEQKLTALNVGDGTIWAVMLRNHIHTNVDKQLALFRTRAQAIRWIKKHDLTKQCWALTFRIRPPLRSLKGEHTESHEHMTSRKERRNGATSKRSNPK